MLVSDGLCACASGGETEGGLAAADPAEAVVADAEKGVLAGFSVPGGGEEVDVGDAGGGGGHEGEEGEEEDGDGEDPEEDASAEAFDGGH